MNAYIEQKILNADPIELIRILYQHGILSIREAQKHRRAGQTAECAKAIATAWAVVAELNSSLRPEVAPEFANRLGGLYFYIQRRLIEANFDQKDAPLTEVLGLMITLSEAWSTEQKPAPTPLEAAASAWQVSMAGAVTSGIEICG